MDDADLDLLTVTPIGATEISILSPPFVKDTTNYSLIVGSGITNVTINAKTSDSGADLEYKGSCNGSSSVGLLEGDNTLKVEVSSEDGSASKTYVVNIKRLSAADASLSSLVPSLGHLVPDFHASTTEYTLNGTSTDTEISFDTSRHDELASVQGGSGPLALGITTIEVIVTSANKENTCTYTVTITRSRPLIPLRPVDTAIAAKALCSICTNVMYMPTFVRDCNSEHLFCRCCITGLLAHGDVFCPLDGLKPTGEGPTLLHSATSENFVSETVVYCPLTGCRYTGPASVMAKHVDTCDKLSQKCDGCGRYVPIAGKETHECFVKCPTCDRKIAKDDMDFHARLFCPTVHSSGTDTTEHTFDVAGRDWEREMRGPDKGGNEEALLKEANIAISKHFSSFKEWQCSNVATDFNIEHLNTAKRAYADILRLRPKNSDAHYRLGLVLEETALCRDLFRHHEERAICGGDEDSDEDIDFFAPKKPVTDSNSKAIDTGREDEISAIMNNYGVEKGAGLDRVLKTLELEYHTQVSKGDNAKAAHVQELVAHKAKQAVPTVTSRGSKKAHLEETSLRGRALLKYRDALSMSHENPDYNFHAGRLLFTEGKTSDAFPLLSLACGTSPTRTEFHFVTGTCAAEAQQHDDVALAFLSEMRRILVDPKAVPNVPVEKATDSGVISGMMSEQPLFRNNPFWIPGLLALSQLHLKAGHHASALNAVSDALFIIPLILQSACGRSADNKRTRAEAEGFLLEGHLKRAEILAAANDLAASENVIETALRFAPRLSEPTSARSLVLRELLAIQGVRCHPGLARAACRLGEAQLALFDASNAATYRTETEKCEHAELSFRASIELEGSKSDAASRPAGISKQSWWGTSSNNNNTKKTTSEGTTNTITTITPLSDSKKGPAPAAKKGALPPVTGAQAASKGKSGTPAPPKGGKPPAKGGRPPPKGAKGATPASAPAPAPAKSMFIHPKPIENRPSYEARLGLARTLIRATGDAFKQEKDESLDAGRTKEACSLYEEVINMAPTCHDAYVELGELLANTSDPMTAIEVYSRFPFAEPPSYDDAYIYGEIVRIVCKSDEYDHVQLKPSLIGMGRVMGLAVISKYISQLEDKGKTAILRSVYAAVNGKSEEDSDMKDFFKFKCW